MPKSKEFINEVNSWKDEGIIDDYQAKSILAKYKLGKAPGKRPRELNDKVAYHGESSSKTIAVVSTLGAILVGIGVILFVASNWNAIPDFAKVILLLTTTFSTYFAGWKFKYDKQNYPLIGDSLLFLASLFVGATIFLTAQIYNVPANSSFLMLLWFFAIAPLTYTISSKPILILSILTFAFWMRSELGGYFNSNFFSTMLIFLAFGISLYGVGQLHDSFNKFKKFKNVYQTFGLIYILSAFYYFSMESIYRFSNFELFDSFFATVAFTVFTIFSIASIVGILIAGRKTTTKLYEFLLLLVSFFGFASTTLFLAMKDNFLVEVVRYGRSFMQLPDGMATVLFIIFTLIVFIIAIGAMLIGYYKSTASFVNVGIIFFILALAHVYWNTAVRFLPRSISLIVGGVVLIAGGIYLEKKRREIMGNMEKHE